MALQVPSQGDLAFALDTATYTIEAALQNGGRSNQTRQRVDLRFALPKWNAHWTGYTFEVEVVLPRGVALHDFGAQAVGEDSTARVVGLNAADNAAWWTVEIDYAQHHRGESETRDEFAAHLHVNNDRVEERQRGWYVLQVKHVGNDAYATLPGGLLKRLYPFSIGVNPRVRTV